MSPGYVFYLYPFLSLENVLLRNWLIYLSQIIFSVGVILLPCRYVLSKFNERIALIVSALYAMLPEFIYATFTYGPIVQFHFLVLLLFIFLNSLQWQKHYIIAPIVMGIIIYFRSEFLLFFVLILMHSLIVKTYKYILTNFAIVGIVLFPWNYRNYRLFDAVVPMTTNGGYNFARGHYASTTIADWPDDPPIEEMKQYPFAKFEIILNNYYTNSGWDYVKKNPMEDLKKKIKKLMYLWILNLKDKRSSNPLYYIPWLTLLATTIIGLLKTYNFNKFKYEYILLLSFSMVVFTFISIPRYQTLMKIILLPFAAYGIEILYRYINRITK